MRRSQIPFALAIAFLAVVYVTLANSSQVSETDMLQGVPKELPCAQASATGWIVRNKTIRDPGCEELWGEAAPRRWYIGRAVRYEGEDGAYFLFEGWLPLPDENCTATDLDEATQFPDETQLYVPKLARLFPFVDPNNCKTNSFREVSVQEVAKLNRLALRTNP